MGAPILEMICFAIVALALAAPRLILHLMSDRPAQSEEKSSFEAQRRNPMPMPARTGQPDRAASA